MSKQADVDSVPDITEVFAAVSRTQSSVESLHWALDGFAARRTSQLKGALARHAIADALASLDKQLDTMEHLRIDEQRRTRGHVTGYLLDSVAEALRHFEGLKEVLYGIYTQPKKHRLSRRQNALLVDHLEGMAISMNRVADELDLDLEDWD